MRRALVLSLLLMASVYCGISGCSGPSQTPENPSGQQGIWAAWIYPSPNTRYIYKGISLDTSTGITVPTMTFDTLYCTSVGTVDGMSQVERFFEPQLPSHQVTNVALDSNHNVSYGQTGLSMDEWIRYPTSSGLPTVDTVADSTAPGAVSHRMFQTREFLGTETISIPSGNVLSYKVRDSLFENFSPADTFIYAETWWYVPEIGTYGKMHLNYLNVGPGSYPSGSQTYTQQLIDYKP